MDTIVEIKKVNRKNNHEYMTGAMGRGLDPPSGLLLNETVDALNEIYGNSLNHMVVERLVAGVFFVGVKFSNGGTGIAYNPPEVVRSAGSRILKCGSARVRGMRAIDVLKGNIQSPFSFAIRLAALNALSQPLFEQNRYRMDTSGDLSGIPVFFKNRRICMVGAVIPLLNRLKRLKTREVVIIDRKKKMTQADLKSMNAVFARSEDVAECLARCDTAVLTAAAVANGTMDNLISMVPEHTAIAVVGPTAGFIPNSLFRRKVAMVGTSMVTDCDGALEIMAEGGGGYRLFRSCVRKINLLNTSRLKELGLDPGPVDPQENRCRIIKKVN